MKFKALIIIEERDDNTTSIDIQCHNTPKGNIENRELALPDTPTGRFAGAVVEYAVHLMEEAGEIVGEPKITVLSVDKENK